MQHCDLSNVVIVELDNIECFWLKTSPEPTLEQYTLSLLCKVDYSDWKSSESRELFSLLLCHDMDQKKIVQGRAQL